jgi:hypothetical protein
MRNLSTNDSGGAVLNLGRIAYVGFNNISDVSAADVGAGIVNGDSSSVLEPGGVAAPPAPAAPLNTTIAMIVDNIIDVTGDVPLNPLNPVSGIAQGDAATRFLFRNRVIIPADQPLPYNFLAGVLCEPQANLRCTEIAPSTCSPVQVDPKDCV